MKNQYIENLRDKQIRLKLLIMAHKAYARAEQLASQLCYFAQKYTIEYKFDLTDFEIEMNEYIDNMEREKNEEEEFFDYVITNYSTNKGTDAQVGEISPINSPWS